MSNEPLFFGYELQSVLWAVGVHTAHYWDTPRLMLSGENLEKINLVRANLEGANFLGANLDSADLRDTNLSGADLERANLRCAILRRACLEGADIHGAILRGADLEGANLERANLRGANLEGADLTGVNLRGANLQRANFSGTKVLYVPAIGSSRNDNIYASPLYTDGKQTGWGWHLGCYYANDFATARARVSDVHGEGAYTRCMDMLYELCLMVFNPNEKDNES